jgi:hypothetical protein
MQAFGGLFATNVIQYLGTAGGKNPEYLLVSGGSASGPSGGQVRAAQSLIYVVDVKLGTFVAFAIPWNRAMENSGMAQMNTLLPVGGDAIRPMTNAGQRKAPALDPNQKANQANPNAANPPNATRTRIRIRPTRTRIRTRIPIRYPTTRIANNLKPLAT